NSATGRGWSAGCSTTRLTWCSTSPRATASAGPARPGCRPSASCSASPTPAPTRSPWPSPSTRTPPASSSPPSTSPGWRGCGARVLGAMRIRPVEPTEHFVYSLEVKRDFRRLVAYDIPADYAPTTLDLIHHAALTAFHALGCRDVARIDFRLRDGVPYFLEANPLPGLNPETGDISLLARFVGVSHAALVGMIVDAALARH